MKLLGHLIIFQKKSEIDFMEKFDSKRQLKAIKLGKVKIFFPKKQDFAESFKNYGEHFMAMGVEIFMCLWAFVGLLFCWMPYVGIDMTKEEEK